MLLEHFLPKKHHILVQKTEMGGTEAYICLLVVFTLPLVYLCFKKSTIPKLVMLILTLPWLKGECQPNKKRVLLSGRELAAKLLISCLFIFWV